MHSAERFDAGLSFCSHTVENLAWKKNLFPKQASNQACEQQVNVSSQEDFLWQVLFLRVYESPRNYKINEALECHRMQKYFMFEEKLKKQKFLGRLSLKLLNEF